MVESFEQTKIQIWDGFVLFQQCLYWYVLTAGMKYWGKRRLYRTWRIIEVPLYHTFLIYDNASEPRNLFHVYWIVDTVYKRYALYSEEIYWVRPWLQYIGNFFPSFYFVFIMFVSHAICNIHFSMTHFVYTRNVQPTKCDPNMCAHQTCRV